MGTKSSWIRGTVYSPSGREYWRSLEAYFIDIQAKEDGLLLIVNGELAMGKDYGRQFNLLERLNKGQLEELMN